MSNVSVERFLPESEDNKILEYVVKATFPNLNPAQQNVLHHYMVGLIQFIATCFDFYSDIDNFRKKLQQNRYKDCRWLLTYLIPYIDTAIRGYDELVDLNQLYTLELDEKHIDDLPQDLQQIVRHDRSQYDLESMSFRAPKYVFSNTQYSRFDKSRGAYRRVEFDYSHIEQNFKLLLGTIKDMRYKMYVNWIDIIPVRMDDFKETDMYRHTEAKLMNSDTRLEEWDPIIDFPLDDLSSVAKIAAFNQKASGMNIEDIYNTISMDLYDSIVQYKWLLFDSVVLQGKDPAIVPNIVLIDTIFPTKEIFQGIDYLEVKDETKDLFEQNYRAITQSYPFQSPLTFLDASVIIPGGTINGLVESLVLFFDQKYSKKSKNNSSYVPLPDEIKKEDVEDYEHIKSYPQEIIKKTLDSMTIPAVYNFITEAIQGLKTTWYGTKLMSRDKSGLKSSDNDSYGYLKWGDRLGEIVTLKNVYNFCKSLIHRQAVRGRISLEQLQEEDPTALYQRLPKMWSELDDSSKEEFTRRLNGEYSSHMAWFNIYWNIMRPKVAADPNYANDSGANQQTMDLMRTIYASLRENILSICFESMIGRGTMTRMVSILEFTNEDLYNLTVKEEKKRLVSRIASIYFNERSPYMTEGYYYLTNKPYSETTPYRIKIDDKIEEYNYAKAVSNSGLAYYLTTAYNWVAQVGFCHKFINNRVNYITASTGAGKSTEVPKLYLYYLKSIDRIDEGTVVVTVPRKNVAEGVSSYISKQMALPYEVYDENDKDMKSTNFTVQFKHSGKNHVRNGRFPKIRFVTDGSVILDMKNPMLRSVSVNKETGNYVYGRNEIYHVVLVDEAHEHNANMDMILSMAKNAAYYNNRFRLGIISATIEADEPAYRRYYRDVNDNRKYPLSAWIAKHNLDRINTERRFNISPPDAGTRFPIEEFYEPGADPVDLVRKIVSTSSEGDILVFQPGTAEISAVVDALNEDGVMPADVIAVPYHAKIASEKQKVKDDISRLKMSKKDNFNKVDIYSGTDTYRRMVLVATNIAEASITIDTLKFVVETGLEKTARFDYRTRTVVVSSNYITEASRLQRKGRVGRTSAGTVYYTYDKGSMESNRKQFNISVQDSHLSVFLGLLRDRTDLPIFTPLVDQIVSGRYESPMLTSLEMKNLVIQSYRDQSSYYDKKYVDSMIEIIEDLYFSNGMYYSHVGEQYSATTFEERPTYPYSLYFSGYDVEQLTDARGKFYIVHPDELVIDRNINGDVIGVDSNVIELKSQTRAEQSRPIIQGMVMHSAKIKAFWSTLLDTRFCEVTTGAITKTPLGSIMIYALSNLTDIQESMDLAKMAILGYGISRNDREFDILLSLICFMAVVDSEPLKAFNIEYEHLSADLRRKYDYIAEKFGVDTISNKDVLDITKDMYNPTEKNRYSDLAILIKVFSEIDTLIRMGEKSDTFEKAIATLRTKAREDQRESDLLKMLQGLSDDTGFDEKALDKRNQLIKRLLEAYSNNVIGSLVDKIGHLRGRGLDDKVLQRYIRLRETIRQKFSDMVNGVDSFKRRVNIDGFESFGDIRLLMRDVRRKARDNGVDLLRTVLLLALPYSIVRKIDNTDHHYVSVYSPDLNTIYSITSTSRNRYSPKTYVDDYALQGYAHYLMSNTDQATITTLTQIRPSDLKIIPHIYSSILKDYGIDTDKERIEAYTQDRREKRYGMNVIPPAIAEGDEFDAINRVGATVAKVNHELREIVEEDQISIELTDELLKI
jgi:Mimiviridae putative ATP-dependent RNA helicase